MALGIARAVPGTEVFASSEAAATMACVPGITAVPVDDLAAAVEIVKGTRPRPEPPYAVTAPIEQGTAPDLAEVLGQRRACRCLEVAAAGGHHLMLEGPPGVARQCWPRGCRGCCRRLTTSKPSRWPPFATPWTQGWRC